MTFLFDSRNPEFKTPTGAAALGERVELRAYADAHTAEVLLLLAEDGEEEREILMRRTGERSGYQIFSVSVALPAAGLYFYRFRVRGDGWEKTFGPGTGGRAEEGTGAWQVLCCAKGKALPKWCCGCVYYQIFPDRFFQEGDCDLSEKLTPFFLHTDKREVPVFRPDERGEITNSDYYGGNLRGVRAKLGYLEELGVQAIYLNPIFMAYSNHRYDTADYKRIDPMLGTENDFCELCRAAHEKGIRVILDGVFSHTGSDSVYFDAKKRFGNGAVSNPDSPYRAWYRFRRYPDEYESWWGIRTLPCVDELAPGFLEFAVTGEDSVVRHWLRLGADGFRLDVADELPDEFLEIFYRTVREEKPEAVVIGEVWEDASDKISYGVRRRYLYGGEMDGVMNYVYRNAVVRFVTGKADAEEFLESVLRLAEHYPKRALDCAMNLLSSHDTERILTVLAGPDGKTLSREERAAARLGEEAYREGLGRVSAAVFLLFTLPGSPCIYYGDEIGMEGYEDPFNRACYDWEGGREEIRRLYREMAALKKGSAALRTGTVEKAVAQDGTVGFFREAEGERLLCAVNVSSSAFVLPYRGLRVRRGERLLLGGEKITLLPYGSGVFEIK